jgi:hypothetical protein
MGHLLPAGTPVLSWTLILLLCANRLHESTLNAAIENQADSLHGFLIRLSSTGKTGLTREPTPQHRDTERL